MKNRRKTLDINRKNLTEAGKKITEAMELLKYCFNLPVQQEIWAEEINADTVEFIRNSIDIAKKYPDLLPPFLNMKTFNDDFSLFHELHSVAVKTAGIKDKVNSMLNTNGNHCLETAMALYNNLKIASKRDIPGARMVFLELKSSLPSKKRKPKNRGVN